MYDTVYHTDKQLNEIQIQFKAGECYLNEYKLGDEIKDVPDGIYYGYNDDEDGGCFVVFNKKIVAVFSNKEPVHFDKHGDRMPFPKID